MKITYPLLKKVPTVCLLAVFVLTSHTAHSQISQWTWVGGDSIDNKLPVFGTRGVPSPATTPANAYGMISFTDTSGNFYLFQGYTYRGNPLWRYNPSTNEWTWLHGDSANTSTLSTGVYGIKGVPAPANIPRKLIGCATWSDANNNCWLFGGNINGAASLSDLWKYNVATNQWTWVNGTGNGDQYGVYGTKGLASPANRPGARVVSRTWTDSAGNLWLFGGQGLTTSGFTAYSLNDVWKYDVAINQWTWMAGDSLGNLPSVYGTLGVASAATNPPSYFDGSHWKDAAGNFWLFESRPPQQGTPLNALWMFSTANAQWTWMGGDTIINTNGNYGIKGVASPSNMPPIRNPAYFWTDNQDNLWIFNSESGGYRNDLWKYNTNTRQWVWLDGDSTYPFVPAYYGSKGFSYFLNFPGTRRLGTTVKDKAGNLWLYGGLHNDPVNSYAYKSDLWKQTPSNYNTLSFNMFVDTNYNGIHEANEPYFRNAKAAISYGTTSFSAASSMGRFAILVDTGTYTTTPALSLLSYNAIPASRTSVFGNTYFHFDSFSFALQPIPGYKDVTINVMPLSPARLGTPLLYKIECYNPGTSTVGGTFNFIKDSKLTYDSASVTPLTISGDTITWSYTNLMPLDTKSILVYLKVKTPPAANINDTLDCVANVALLPGESNTADNSASVAEIIIGGYDPNDKTESHGGKIALSKAAAGEYLQYTIRFQNTGNDTAFNIFVRDTLSTKLNWNTLEMVSASHNYQMTMNDGKCVWSFRNIHLVDSLHNEPKSHGYIVYKIKPKPTVQVGDVIKNRAAIYFDYNLPVITNTEMTTVVAEAFPLKLLSFTAKKQDKAILLNWTTTNEVNVDRFEVERSPNGREFERMQNVKCKMQNENTYDFIDHSPLTFHNYYRLKIVDKDGSFSYSKIVEVTLSIVHSPLSIALYPNPAKDKLQVLVESDKKVTLQMQVIGHDGKVVLSRSLQVAIGSSLQTINIAALPAGSYFLRVETGRDLSLQADKKQVVVKFEKL